MNQEYKNAWKRSWYQSLSPEKKAAFIARQTELKRTPERLEKAREYNKQYYAKNRERIAEQIKARRKRDWPKIREANKAYRETRKDQQYLSHATYTYGVTRDELNGMREACGNRCEICGGPPTSKHGRLAVDHDHDTGVVRGLLCGGCNRGLGAFGDSVARLHKAALYLARHKAKGEVA